MWYVSFLKFWLMCPVHVYKFNHQYVYIFSSDFGSVTLLEWFVKTVIMGWDFTSSGNIFNIFIANV